MADSVFLTDGTTTITLVSGGSVGVGSAGVRIGPVEQGRQTVTLEGAQIRGSTADNLLDRYNELERLLHDAQSFRAQGLGRRLSLTIQPNGASNPTTYYVRKGRVADLPSTPSFLFSQRQYLGPFTLELDVEPFGRGAEVTLVNATGTLRSRPHITHRYLHGTGGTVFSVNLIAQTGGSLWQTTKFSTAPTTVTPAAADKLYFGSTLAIFDRLVLGISTVAAGITWGAWEYWSGAAWSSFTPSTNDLLTGSNQFGVADRLGQIIFPTLSGWAATTINAVSAFWVRLNVTSVSSPTAPIMTNGQVRSVAGIASIASTDVDGDVPALGLIHLKNDGATALGGVRAALATCQLDSAPPPFSIPILSATTFVPTGGDNPLTVATDAEATCGERVEVSLASVLSDASQTFDGTSEHMTVTLVSGDKIDSIGGGSFFIEVEFSTDTEVTRPMPLCSRWDASGSNRIFWLGIDDLRLRGMVSTDGSKRKIVNGNTQLKARTRYMATLEFDSTARKINLYLDSKLEASQGVGSNTIRRNQTTALRVAQSVSYASADSRSGQDSEDWFDGSVGWVFIYGDRVDDFRTDVLGGDDYNYPNDVSNEVARADSASVRALYQMNDNAATTVVVDSAVTYGAAKNLARNVGNTSTNRRPGVLNSGVGQFARLVAGALPPCLLEEYAGTFHMFLAVKQATALTELTDISFQLQLNVGDTRLPFGPPAFLPDLNAPASSGYHILDLGLFTLPPAGLYDGYRGSGSAARHATWNLYVKHAFTSNKVLHLDNIYPLPVDTWYGEYDAFDDHYEAAYAIAQNAGVVWNAEGPVPLAYQTTTAGLAVQERNPYAVPVPTAPRLHPRKAAYLSALTLRADATGDYLYRVISDTVTPTVKAIPRFRALAGT